LAAIVTHRADNLAEVFAAAEDFRLGMHTLSRALSAEAIIPEVARYTLQLVDLARRLRGNPRMSARLGEMLDQLAGTEPDASDFAQVYQQTISRLGKPVQVTGDPALLRQEAVANSIRAQLLAGVRFAWLWRQLGGRRWHLILRRRSLLVALQSLMSRD
jgi:high frequency lysogenization protein